MSTIMQFGNYNFSPVPLMKLAMVPDRNGVGDILGFKWQMSLSGDLILQSGISILDIDEMQDLLASGMQQGNGTLFHLECDSATLLDCYPKLVSGPDFAPGQWVNRSPYTIDFEFDTLHSGDGPTQYISDFTEEWTMEFQDDKTQFSWTLPDATVDFLPISAKLTHNISATGKAVFGPSGLLKMPYKQAREFVSERLGSDNDFIENSGIINFSPANFGLFNHFRVINANESQGTYGVNESWLIVGSGYGSGDWAGKAIEDFTVSIEKTNESRFYNLSIEGTIQGLEERVYDFGSPDAFKINEYRYDNALDYWNNIEDRLISRCQLVLNNTISPSTRNLNIITLNETMSHNPYLGTIQYSRRYNDRPSNCLTGVLSESISLEDNNGGDLFASIFVLGRGDKGPVLQNLNTKSIRTRRLNIECIMNPAEVCPSSSSAITSLLSACKPSNVDTIIDNFETHIEGTGNSVFRTEDTESTDIKQGRYSRSVTWSWAKC